MSSPIDLVLSRLKPYRLAGNGRDRWRSCCPGHGGANPSALSIGVGRDEAVLLKCWVGCDIERVLGSLGLDVGDLFPRGVEGRIGVPPIRRRRLLTAAQALDLLDFEMGLTLLVASDMGRGLTPDPATRERLLLAAARVSMLRDEVAS